MARFAPAFGVPVQTIAMVFIGAAAAIAAIYEGTIGASLVASGLLGHAVSDLYHHRVNKVVTRSMAEFRAVLDTLLAAVIIVAVMKTGG